MVNPVFSFLVTPAQKGRPPIFIRCGQDDAIKQSIRAVLLTRRGERTANREIGSRVSEHLFRPVVGQTLSSVAHAAREAIETAVDGIEVLDLSAEPDPSDRCRVILGITYRIKATSKMEKVQLALSP